MTDTTACTLCTECQAACPRGGISFGWGRHGGRRWEGHGVDRSSGEAVLAGRLVAAPGPTRREVLRGAGAGAAAAAAGLALVPAAALLQRPGVIRPPGAASEADLVRDCLLCQECVRVCPTGSIRPTFLEAGLGAMGTPRLVPRLGGCTLNPSCAHLCASVCPSGALRPLDGKPMRIGVARVDHTLCLAWDQGVKCLVCVEACPEDAARYHKGRVSVDPRRCTGCGRCEAACPVAGSAIRVVVSTRA